ncbi:hypothetical protein [Haladaptatus sp. YSMS36]|uniref:hypothetical protein n=1 Tax=Haladaptatus sp. YSMS36 TaxID=3033384 RepID=UPI0023E892AE|nr:hypothetical protein [Haladaptatus sp. YSMS36]
MLGFDHVASWGPVWQKAIDVAYGPPNDRVRTGLAHQTLGTTEKQYVEVPYQYDDAYEPPASFSVSQALHDKLQADFWNVSYRLEIQGGETLEGDHLGGIVSRKTFNRVGIHDRAQVYEWDGQVHTLRTADRTPKFEETELSRYDAEALPGR